MTLRHRRVHYVLSTHWDREWYQTFQQFRFRLVKMIDRILEGWNTGELQGPLQTDGQAILLEDYLEVRPERRAEIEQRAREGKLVIGPWYAMPDEFLESGESLVRNLRRGRALARAFGGQPSRAGFCCDMFGHNSQLPQIYAGFGLLGALIWRGVNTWDKRSLLWEAADGTVLPAFRFGHSGYCTFAHQTRGTAGSPQSQDPQWIGEQVDSQLAWDAECTDTDPMLFFDGCDHFEWDPTVYAVLAERFDEISGGFELVHTDLDTFVTEMAAQADRIQTRVRGELREPAQHSLVRDNQWLIPGVLSSRVWIKQDNAVCETLLTRHAEPLGVLGNALLGLEYPAGLLDVAWRWLLSNHPHDSMCGCSIDQVHEDMKYRFSQCRAMGRAIVNDTLLRLAANVGDPVEAGTTRMLLWNGAQQAIDGTVELTVDVPAEWPTFNEFFGFEPKPGFRIYDPEGNEVPYQRLSQAMNRPSERVFDRGVLQQFRVNQVGVSLPVSIPALGYTTLTIKPAAPREPTRYPAVPGLATSERSMENEHLAVTIEPNGSLSLLDKDTGQAYTRLLTFEDIADIGDGWFHGQAVNDQWYSSTASPAAVALVHDGPFVTTFSIRTRMEVPAAFDFHNMIRTPERAELVIESLVTLRPGVRHVEVHTTVHNNVLDHRLRVLFPSGADTDTWLADTPFDVVERPVALRSDNHLYRELEVEGKPQRTWSAVADGTRGLAVISEGLLETAVRDLPERPLALTLFRATRRTVNTAGEPQGQLQGDLEFDYWIAPLSAVPASAQQRAVLFGLADRLACGVRWSTLQAIDGEQVREEGGLAPTDGLLRVEGPVVLSAVEQRTSEEGAPALEIRAFNPGDEPVQARYWTHPALGCVRAIETNLEGTPTGTEYPMEDRAVTVPLGGKKIVTVQLMA
ncbi:MAG: glycoside hydrolase family 38 C-terminal domain-containing protein [Anaerolineae bacterium]|jgi:alpha-mannosidase|nr:glycoside hydrolase family 38 [Chloroflexota bacterium]